MKRTGTRFRPRLAQENYDAIVIGSGIGGLTTAALLATPLSTEWFQWNEQGEIYGIDHTVQRFEQHWIHSQTPIKGLYLTGADTVTAGVGGALMAGVLTATRMLGWRGYKVAQLLKNWRPDAAKSSEVQVPAR